MSALRLRDMECSLTILASRVLFKQWRAVLNRTLECPVFAASNIKAAAPGIYLTPVSEMGVQKEKHQWRNPNHKSAPDINQN